MKLLEKFKLHFEGIACESEKREREIKHHLDAYITRRRTLNHCQAERMHVFVL